MAAVEAVVREAGVSDAAFMPAPADWMPLETPGGLGAAHFVRHLLWEDCTDGQGAALLAGPLLSYARGWALAASRQDAAGPTRMALDAMWEEAIAAGPASRAKLTGQGQARGLLRWFRASPPPGLLGPWRLPRGGSFTQQVVEEVELRAILSNGVPAQVRAVLAEHAPLLVASLEPLDVVFSPVPEGSLFLGLADRLLSGLADARAGGGPRRLESLEDVRQLATRVAEFVPTVEAEAARLAAAVPPRTADAVARVEAILADRQHVLATERAAPKVGSGAGAGGRAGAGEGAATPPAYLDSTQSGTLLTAFRSGENLEWLRRLEELAKPQPTPSGGTGAPAPGAAVADADPHGILAHLMTSKVRAVRRFAVGSLATLPLPAFGLEAVSTAPAHFGAYLAEAILTGEDGVPATQRGKRLVLPEKMVKAAAAHDWRAVDWEELVLLVKEALEPVKYTRRVPPGEEWTCVLRAPDLRTYGSRLVVAAGGAKAEAANSFAVVVAEWEAFLRSQDSVGGEVLRDHVANARTFMLDSLALAAKHGMIAAADTNPLGAILPYFVPAGAAPFDDLDRHRAAKEGVVQMASTFPSVAAALGVERGLTAPGVTASPLKRPLPAPAGGEVPKEEPDPEPKTSKRAAKRARAALPDRRTVVRGEDIVRPDGSTAKVSEVAAAAGVAVDALCWPVVAASGEAAVRLGSCPCRQKKGHEGPNSAMHKRPKTLSGLVLHALFQGQRQ